MKRTLFILLLAAGCTSYQHARYDATTGKLIEKTSLMAPMLTKTAIEGLKSSVREKSGTNTYSRIVGVEGLDNSTDTNALKAAVDAAVTAAVKAAK